MKYLNSYKLFESLESAQEQTLKLIAFVRKKHPKSKIEVKFKEEN
jgi:hypothetical protein